MADTKLADLTAATTLADADLLYAVVDPAGSPLDRKVTVSTLRSTVSGALFPRPVSGDYVMPQFCFGNSTFTGTLNRCVFTAPLIVDYAFTADRIVIVVNTAAASAVLRVGIHICTAATSMPTTLLLDAGTADASTTGVKEITISQAIPTGVYRFSVTPQVVVSSPRGFAGTTSTSISSFADSTLGVQTVGASNFYEVGVTGALPGTVGTITWSENATSGPIVALRST